MHQPSGANKQKLDILQKGRFFSFYVVTYKLKNPRYNKYGQVKVEQVHVAPYGQVHPVDDAETNQHPQTKKECHGSR